VFILVSFTVFVKVGLFMGRFFYNNPTFCTRLSPSMNFEMIGWSIWSYVCTRLWPASTWLFVYACFESPCHTHSTFPAKTAEDDVRADVVDRYNYHQTNLTWGLIPVNTQWKDYRMRLWWSTSITGTNANAGITCACSTKFSYLTSSCQTIHCKSLFKSCSRRGKNTPERNHTV